MSIRLVVLITVAAMCLTGCQRDEPGIPLIAAFSTESGVGRLLATWLADSSGRATYRVDVVNQLSDPLYVRLSAFTLLRDGESVGQASETAACLIPAGTTARPLEGTLVISGEADGFDVDRFALPLSARGLGLYREYLLQRRPGQEPAIDAEIAAYGQAPACATP